MWYMSVWLESADMDGPSAVIPVARRDCARYDFAIFGARSVSILGMAEERWVALNIAFLRVSGEAFACF
jgi:hypothetical protein